MFEKLKIPRVNFDGYEKGLAIRKPKEIIGQVLQPIRDLHQ